MAGKKHQVITGVVVSQFHWRRKSTQERGDHGNRYPAQLELRTRFPHVQYVCETLTIADNGSHIVSFKRHIVTVGVQQANGKWQMKRGFLFLSRCGRTGLFNDKGKSLRSLVKLTLNLNDRRTRLRVPVAELGEFNAAGVFHRTDKIFGRDCLPVMAFKVEVTTSPEAFGPKQLIDHADNLCTFLINRHGVEVVDLYVRIRSYRVRHRAGVFRELGTSQSGHITDALYDGRAHVGRKLLVPENSKPLFEAQLEPVPAGDPVA